MRAALPRSEYYEGPRLLPARLPPFGLAYRVGHTLARRQETSRVPTVRVSAMPRSWTPPRSPRPRLLSGACCCLPGRGTRRPSVDVLTGLNLLALSGCGLVVALPTLSARPRGPRSQGSLRREWLALRRQEFHLLCTVSFRGAPPSEPGVRISRTGLPGFRAFPQTVLCRSRGSGRVNHAFRCHACQVSRPFWLRRRSAQSQSRRTSR